MSKNILSVKNIKNINNKKQKYYIEKLSLKNFRNHIDLNLNTSDLPILIYGENGCGKTNILEAISLLNQGKGLRKSNIDNYLCEQTKNEQNLRWGINADFVTPNGNFNIGTGLKDDSYNKSRVAKINSENTMLSSLEQIVKISWITPQMIVLFQSGMNLRRRFIDSLTSSLDNLHINRVYKYEKLLRQRNKILIEYNDQVWLDTIERQISELSVAITSSRIDLVCELNNLYKTELKYDLLTNRFPPVEVKLVGEIESLLLERSALEVEEHIVSKLKETRTSFEMSFGGPNNTRVEIINRNNNKNVDISSTGEQKLILISIILSHARMLNLKFNMAPILLLDDIIEHLDTKNRDSLFLEVCRHQGQTWFTSTSKEAFDGYPGQISKINLPKLMHCADSKYDYRYGEI